MVWIPRRERLAPMGRSVGSRGETALVADYLGREADGSDLAVLFEWRRSAAHGSEFLHRERRAPGRSDAEPPGERPSNRLPVIVRIFTSRRLGYLRWLAAVALERRCRPKKRVARAALFPCADFEGRSASHPRFLGGGPLARPWGDCYSAA